MLGQLKIDKNYILRYIIEDFGKDEKYVLGLSGWLENDKNRVSGRSLEDFGSINCIFITFDKKHISPNHI